MNGPEVLTDFRHRLAARVAAHETPRVEPLPVTPWLAMAALQKGIRRGRRDLATRAAATLLVEAPDRLWRRLGCIAFEDIGLADLDAVGLVTAALGGKRVRAQLGGEWPVASVLVDLMAAGRLEEPLAFALGG